MAATNQLAALLGRHWPGATTIFGRLDSDIALAFLDDYPTPVAAARLGEARLAMFCRRHSYCGRRSPAQLLERLRRAPQPTQVLSPEPLVELVWVVRELFSESILFLAQNRQSSRRLRRGVPENSYDDSGDDPRTGPHDPPRHSLAPTGPATSMSVDNKQTGEPLPWRAACHRSGDREVGRLDRSWHGEAAQCRSVGEMATNDEQCRGDQDGSVEGHRQGAPLNRRRP